MIDIHTHIIPNVDDGSQSIETSRRLLELEKENGVTKVFLTPHQNAMRLEKSKILDAFIKFKNDVSDIDVELFLGSEIYYYDNLINDLKNGTAITMNNSLFVLVEFSTRYDTNIIDKLYDIIVSGYIPIVAHIERYPYLKFSDYDEIAKMGARIQVNTKSFHEKGYKKIIKYLLKKNYIDFVGTDCHDLENRSVEYNFEKIFKKYPQFKTKLEYDEMLIIKK